MEKTLVHIARKGSSFLSACTLLSLGVLFVILFAQSLEADLFYNQAFMTYLAYLINEHGFILYQDFFEFNMPLSYLFHIIIGKLFGYSATAFKVVHVLWLVLLFFITWFLMKAMGKTVAIASYLLFGVIYLNFGAELLLERDIIAITPIAVAALVATSSRLNHRKKQSQFLIGLFMALATLIKPYLLIGLPLFILYSTIEKNFHTQSMLLFFKKLFMGSFMALLGFLLPISITFIWLWKLAALTPFLDMLQYYVPIYRILDHPEFANSYERITYFFKLASDFFFKRNFFHIMQRSTELIGALLGTAICLMVCSSRIKKRQWLLFATAIFYIIAISITGKFWAYYWMPFNYFACLCTAMVFVSARFIPMEKMSSLKQWSLVLLKSAACLLILSKTVYTFIQLSNNRTPPQRIVTNPYYTNVAEIATYLNEHLEPHDKVQPLDWIAGGAIHGMLQAKAVVATPYVTDFQFYYHDSNPYVQQLRQDFMLKLKKAQPRFIIDSPVLRILSGKHVNYNFPALEAFIEKNYTLDFTGERNLKIYKRNP
ncbi:MAG: hypothetical protein ACPGJS_23925 [Flammeovirgaceae bacterium]